MRLQVFLPFGVFGVALWMFCVTFALIVLDRIYLHLLNFCLYLLRRLVKDFDTFFAWHAVHEADLGPDHNLEAPYGQLEVVLLLQFSIQNLCQPAFNLLLKLGKH